MIAVFIAAKIQERNFPAIVPDQLPSNMILGDRYKLRLWSGVHNHRDGYALKILVLGLLRENGAGGGT